MATPGRVRIEQPFVSSNPLDLTGRLADYTDTIGGMTVLNLGAGRCDSPISSQILVIPCRTVVNVDTHEPALTDLKGKAFAAKETVFVHGDVMAFVDMMLANERKADVVMLLDVLEHFTATDGIVLLTKLKAIARAIYIWVPIGQCPQDPYDNNPHQLHQSTWDALTLSCMGFDVDWYPALHRHYDPPVDAAWAVWKKE